MKKLIVTLVCSCLFAGSVFAQKELTTAQKSFQTSIINFLREEGYSPSLTEDNWIKFKSEGKTYFISIESEMPFFVTFMASGFTLKGENAFNLTFVMLACNDVNSDYRAVKLYWTLNESISLQIEQYTRSAEDFKYVFAKNLSILIAARQHFLKKYEEWEKVN